MKKISVLFLLVLLPVLASAVETVEIKGIWYALDAEHSCATVVKNPYKYAGDVIIPEQVEYGEVTYDVTAIAAETFSGCPSLVSVLIGNAVTSIGTSAFHGCSSLKTVIIGSSVTSTAAVLGNLDGDGEVNVKDHVKLSDIILNK